MGQRYCTLPYFYDNAGTSADFAVVDARYITPAPEGLGAVEATSVWMQYMTAFYPVIDISKAGPGTNILATAGTSTAGTATATGPDGGRHHDHHHPLCRQRSLPASQRGGHVVTGEDTDIAAAIHAATDGVGAHVAFDPVGQGMIARYSPALAKGATIFFYGTLDGVFPQLPIVDMFQANATFTPIRSLTTSRTQALQQGLVCLRCTQGRVPADRPGLSLEYRDAWDYLSQPRESHGKIRRSLQCPG